MVCREFNLVIIFSVVYSIMELNHFEIRMIFREIFHKIANITSHYFYPYNIKARTFTICFVESTVTGIYMIYLYQLELLSSSIVSD